MRASKHPVRELLLPAYARLYPVLHRMRRFEYDGHTYEYMFHPYGATLFGERIVEVPIALREVRSREGQSILEVGNVLRHYHPFRHLVVDMYEVGDGFVRQDVMEFEPDEPFEFILSISTVEHIGWNEYEKAPEKAISALERMKGMLAPGGTMMVTVPWGYNPALGPYLQSPECLFTDMRYLRRTSRKNTWTETDATACESAKYGEPFPFANVLVLGYATVPGDEVV